MNPPSRVAVLQPAYLGDVIFAGPLTRAVASAWPEARVRLLVRPPAGEIAAWLPGVHEVQVYDKRGADRGWAGWRRAVAGLRAFRPDLVIALHGSPRTAALALASGAPQRVGPAEGLGAPLYSATESFEHLPLVERGGALARALELPFAPQLQLSLPAELRAAGAQQVPPGAVALVPGSEWETKRWPIERAAELAAELLRRGHRPVLLGSPAEAGLCAALDALTGGRCLNLCGNTVAAAAAVLAACACAVGGDSGLLHLARALGCPCAVLFGPTSPVRHLAEATEVFLSLNLPCSPCGSHGGRSCPEGHHRCLRELKVERVLRVVEQLC